MEFIEISEQEYHEYSLAHPDGGFWQSVDMAQLREWNHWNCVYVGLKENKKLCAAAMLSYRKVFLGATFVQALRGFLIDYEDESLVAAFHHGLRAYLKKLNCMYFKTDPYVAYKQRDENGNLVEGGFDHSGVVNTLKQLGYEHDGFLRGMTTVREPNWMFVATLKGKSEAQLLKEFDHQTRWSINKTLKMGIRVREISEADLPAYKQMMEHTGERRGFDDHDMHYYEGLFQTFGKRGHLRGLFAELDLVDYQQRLQMDLANAHQQLEEIKTVLQELPNSKKFNKKKKVVDEEICLLQKKQEEAKDLQAKHGDTLLLAASTFILYGREVMYLYSGAYEEFMKFNGPYAIQWAMIREALAKGYEYYNFYGISGIFEKDAQDYGIYEFKKGFTGQVVELIGDFYLYPQRTKYKMYEALRKVKHALHV